MKDSIDNFLHNQKFASDPGNFERSPPIEVMSASESEYV
jgi:hypothetical protein